MKKLISIFLIAFFLIGALSGCVSANKPSITDKIDAKRYGLKFSLLSDGTYGVKEAEEHSFEKITIPSTYNGKAVTAIIANAFINSDIEEIIISDSVKTIEENAFLLSDGLKKITISSSVESIDKTAFYRCYSLISITVDKKNPVYKSIDENLYSKDGATLIQYAIGKTEDTFNIPDNVTKIGDNAFLMSDNLVSVNIGNKVESIGNNAFSFCKGITNIDIPNSVTSIGKYAFSNCDGLTSIVIPSNVTSIGDMSFSFCNELTDITISNGATSIGSRAFYSCASLSSVTIPNSITSIGREAFDCCYELTDIIFENSDEWYIFENSNSEILTNISPDDLADAYTSAIYLKDTYAKYYWKHGA